MALHQSLPIYRDTYALLQQTTLVARNIPRDVKRAVSDKLLSESLDMAALISRANTATEKAKHIEDLRVTVHAVEMLLRLCKDMHWISMKQYSSLVELTQSIGRQSTGWLKQSRPSPAA